MGGAVAHLAPPPLATPLTIHRSKTSVLLLYYAINPH